MALALPGILVELIKTPGLFTSLISDSLRFGWGTLLADIGVTLAIAIPVVLLFARHRRRYGRWFRFSLRGLLVLTGACAIFLAWWASTYREWTRQEMILEQWKQHPTTDIANWACVSCGPEWLRRLLPCNDPDIFKRVTYFSVKFEEYNQANFETELARQSANYDSSNT